MLTNHGISAQQKALNVGGNLWKDLQFASYNKKVKTIVLILTNFILTATFGQTDSNENCVTNYNPKTKVTKFTYPFSKAEKILIVKYKTATVQGKPDVFSWDIPKKGTDIDTTRFLANYQLTGIDIESLLGIINQGSKYQSKFEAALGEPSNAILFFDNTGMVFEYIVVGFGFFYFDKLNHYTEVTSSAKVTLGLACSDKGQMLIDFFQKRGVETIIK